MARSDLLLNLAAAGTRGDKPLFRRTLEALIADERAKQHHVLADRLAVNLAYHDAPNGNGNGAANRHASAVGAESAEAMLAERVPSRLLDDLVLPPVVRQTCDELIEEQARTDLLRSYSLEPRHRVLLVGPPGTGKTSLAEAMATALYLPLLTVRYEGLIGSYLGETASRLARLFAYVRARQCVLFIDEVDTIAKERGDVHDTGEIKRVVSSLLLQIDALPSHVVVVTATNHPELLDRAVWRRFQVRLRLPLPTLSDRAAWIERLGLKLGEPLGYSPTTLAKKLGPVSFAELEEFANDVARRKVLTTADERLSAIVKQRLDQWHVRARYAGPAEAAAEEC